jgi:hypothetical protein
VVDVQLPPIPSNTTLNTLEFKKMILEQAENVNLTTSILNIQQSDLLKKQTKLINKEKKDKEIIKKLIKKQDTLSKIVNNQIIDLITVLNREKKITLEVMESFSAN